MTAESRLERIADGRTDLVWVHVAEGGLATAGASGGRPLISFMRDCRTRGEAPLHRAAAFGTEETIDLLLGKGAHLEARDANGDTPLAWASWYARPDAIVRKLCWGEHRIHPDRKPMALSLLGWPRGASTGGGRAR